MAEEVFKQKDGSWVGVHSARKYGDYSVTRIGPEGSRSGVVCWDRGEQNGEPFTDDPSEPFMGVKSKK
jgi:hypothetical protein